LRAAESSLKIAVNDLEISQIQIVNLEQSLKLAGERKIVTESKIDSQREQIMDLEQKLEE